MNSRRALAFIFCTVTLDMLAVGLMIPVLPGIVLAFMDGDTAGAAEVFGLFATVWGLMQLLSSPLLGALSDRFGRRPVILISCLGLGLDYIFMALAPSLMLLFIGRVISGITAATISTSFAYIADVTTADNRAHAFGPVGMGLGPQLSSATDVNEATRMRLKRPRLMNKLPRGFVADITRNLRPRGDRAVIYRWPARSSSTARSTCSSTT